MDGGISMQFHSMSNFCWYISKAYLLCSAIQMCLNVFLNKINSNPVLVVSNSEIKIKQYDFLFFSLYWVKSIRCKLNFNFQSRFCEHVVNDGLIMILYSERVRRAIAIACRHFNYAMLYIKYICHISGITKWL